MRLWPSLSFSVPRTTRACRTPHSRTPLAVMVSLALPLVLAPAKQTLAQVELRGEPAALDAEIVRIGPSGIEVRPADAPADGAKTRLISWDRIRRVAGARAMEAGLHSELADGLWRGRARLERGDRRAAELLFDALYLKHAGLGGPSGAVLAEGTLRTRLARGARATAVAPWLEWLNIRYSAGQKQLESWLGGKINLPEVMDAERGLCPRLPPVFSMLDDAVGVRLLAEDAPWARLHDADPAVRELAELYRTAARFETELQPRGLNAPEPTAPAIKLPEARSTEDHIVLVGEIVRSRVGTPEERKEARARLSRRVKAFAIGTDDLTGDSDAPSAGQTRYLEAWCRAAIGRSLLRDATPEAIRAGVIEMLHVPARLADAAPELARLVLLDAADAMARAGDTAAAAALREEAKVRFHADRPIDDWSLPTEGTDQPLEDTISPSANP